MMDANQTSAGQKNNKQRHKGKQKKRKETKIGRRKGENTRNLGKWFNKMCMSVKCRHLFTNPIVVAAELVLP